MSVAHCSNCGYRTHVQGTKIQETGHVYRKRVCGKCGHIEPTMEMSLEQIRELQEMVGGK